MNNKIKNIIFDMNGTMIFDGKYHEIAWKDYAEKLAGRQMSTEEFQHHVLGHTADIPWAIRVARAAPKTPRPRPATIQRSITIFKTEENIKRPNGIFDSPIELNIVERILYINKNGNPAK